MNLNDIKLSFFHTDEEGNIVEPTNIDDFHFYTSEVDASALFSSNVWQTSFNGLYLYMTEEVLSDETLTEVTV